MSYVIAAPEMMTSAATDLAGIGSALSAAHMAAAVPTAAVIPAAADEVSAGIAHLFSQYAGEFQSLAGKAATFHEQFVQHLNAGAGSSARPTAALSTLLNRFLTDFINLITTNPLNVILTGALLVAVAILFWPITLSIIILAPLVLLYLAANGFLV